MPTISVIVPVYKVEKYILRCVDSILGQTYEDFELILVDDGSPDNCGAICDEYAAKDSRVVVIHQENGGLSAARNAGIDWAFANSDSQWLTFIDSDDWVHPEYLERLLDAVRVNDADLAFCTLTAFTEDDKGYQIVPFWGKPVCEAKSGMDILRESMQERKGMMSGHYVIACNKIYQKALYTDIRYPSGQVHEDEAVAHRIISNCNKVVGIAEPLYNYRQHFASITKEHTGYYRDLCIALAYGDRILYCAQKGIPTADELFGKYWRILISDFCEFYKDKRCVGLDEKAKKQMREVVVDYRKSGDSIIRKAVVWLFCLAPELVSRVFRVSVKVRGG